MVVDGWRSGGMEIVIQYSYVLQAVLMVVDGWRSGGMEIVI